MKMYIRRKYNNVTTGWSWEVRAWRASLQSIFNIWYIAYCSQKLALGWQKTKDSFAKTGQHLHKAGTRKGTKVFSVQEMTASLQVLWTHYKVHMNSVLWRRQWHPTPVLLPGKSHGWRSLVGCSPWGSLNQALLSNFTFTFQFHALGKEMATKEGQTLRHDFFNICSKQ